jgi:hypothetical protein
MGQAGGGKGVAGTPTLILVTPEQPSGGVSKDSGPARRAAPWFKTARRWRTSYHEGLRGRASALHKFALAEWREPRYIHNCCKAAGIP